MAVVVVAGTAFSWYLANPTTEDTAQFDATRATCGQGTTIRDTYGMRAGKVIQL